MYRQTGRLGTWGGEYGLSSSLEICRLDVSLSVGNQGTGKTSVPAERTLLLPLARVTPSAGSKKAIWFFYIYSFRLQRLFTQRQTTAPRYTPAQRMAVPPFTHPPTFLASSCRLCSPPLSPTAAAAA